MVEPQPADGPARRCPTRWKLDHMNIPAETQHQDRRSQGSPKGSIQSFSHFQIDSWAIAWTAPAYRSWPPS